MNLSLNANIVEYWPKNAYFLDRSMSQFIPQLWSYLVIYKLFFYSSDKISFLSLGKNAGKMSHFWESVSKQTLVSNFETKVLYVETRTKKVI